MRKLIATLAALAAMVFAGTATAAIPISQAPAGPGYQNLSPYTCEGRTFYLTPHYFDPDPITGIAQQIPGSGLPIRLQFGWGAHTPSQMAQFFKYSSGIVSITGTDTCPDSGPAPRAAPRSFRSRGSPGAPWPRRRSPHRVAAQTLEGVNSLYRVVLGIAPGTYTLTATFVHRPPIQDGFGSYKGVISGTCSFTVIA